jgi:hypothetical protein
LSIVGRLQRLQSVLRSKDRGSRERRRRILHNFFKEPSKIDVKELQNKKKFKELEENAQIVKDSCERKNRLKISRNRSNLSKIVADHEETVKFFQIFERFTNLFFRRRKFH